MAYSIIQYTATGLTNTYAINFALGFNNRNEVTCQVNNEVDGLGAPVYRSLTWINDGLVTVDGVLLTAGWPVVFKRTVTKTTLIHDYSNGEAIEESNLDESNKQNLMAIHEVLDGRLTSALQQDLDMGTHKITNLVDGINPQDAVTFSQLNGVTGGAGNGAYLDVSGSQVQDDVLLWNTGTVKFIRRSLSYLKTQLGIDGLTAFGQTIINAATASSGRAAMGLGSIATQDSNGVSITGGSINGTAIGATTPSSAVITTQNGGQLAGTRNRVINGGMLIDQRNNGASQTILNGTASYTVDRMFAFSTGANCSGQRVYYATNRALYRFTGAASVTAINFGHKFESLNITDLAGQTVTLSVKLANSVLTNVSWSAYYANALDNFGATTSIASGAFTVNSTLTKYSTQISLPAGAANGVVITLSVGAQTSGTWDITELQLESGSVATPFEQRLISLELMACQRYYEVGTYIWRGFATSGVSFGGSQAFAVVKRSSPTVTPTSTSAISFPVVNSTINGSNTQGFDISRAANATVAGVFSDTWTATSEL